MNGPSLRSLTYVSRASEPMSDVEFTQLGLEAGRLNALDGITGLLVFNGERFCQTIEGSREAIDSLMERLRRDLRHEDVRVLADEAVNERRFRSWDMQLLAVPDERDAALAVASARLDSELDVAARARVYATVEGVFA
jgi:hypothetical protein